MRVTKTVDVQADLMVRLFPFTDFLSSSLFAAVSDLINVTRSYRCMLWSVAIIGLSGV